LCDARGKRDGAEPSPLPSINPSAEIRPWAAKPESDHPMTTMPSDDDPAGAGSPGFYANPTSRRKVDLPSLINLLLGAGDGPPHRAPDHPNGNAVDAWMRPTTVDLAAACGRIDWGRDADALLRGDLGALAPNVADLIRAAARASAIAAYARLWGIDVIAAVIAILAASEAKSNRAAERLARAILTEAAAGEIEMALRDVGLR
jgi:hypothetical protein